jgi:hypothetical protein
MDRITATFGTEGGMTSQIGTRIIYVRPTVHESDCDVVVDVVVAMDENHHRHFRQNSRTIDQ